MSIYVLSWAFAARPTNALQKLILIRMADTSDSGTCEFRLSETAHFCCEDEEIIAAAIRDLCADNLLEQVGINWFKFVGYEPPVFPDGYAKKTITKPVRKKVFERDGYVCKHCGSSEKLTVDHVVPESRGGVHDISNFQTLCRSCNSRKGAKV